MDLNEKIALHVLNWTRENFRKEEVPDFAHKLEATEPVIQEMLSRGYKTIVGQATGQPGFYYIVSFEKEEVSQASVNTDLPMAICNAALAAVLFEQEQKEGAKQK